MTTTNIHPPRPDEPFADKRKYSREGLSIVPARRSDDLEQVYRLIHDAYLEKGYCDAQDNQQLTYFEHLDHIPETTIFLARLHDQYVGTLSLTEHNALGVPVDDVFKPAYDDVVNENVRTAVIWRLAIAKPYREMTFIVVELIKRTLWRCFDQGIDASISTVHQRQERLYKKLFNMSVLAYNDGIADFAHVPCVMLRWDREKCPRRWHPPTTG
jgi:hypothetical protein